MNTSRRCAPRTTRKTPWKSRASISRRRTSARESPNRSSQVYSLQLPPGRFGRVPLQINAAAAGADASAFCGRVDQADHDIGEFLRVVRDKKALAVFRAQALGADGG